MEHRTSTKRLSLKEARAGPKWNRLNTAKIASQVNLRIISKPTLKLALVIGMQLREKTWVWLPAQK